MKSGRFSRSKGQRGERELFTLLSEKLGVEIRRGLNASRDGGADSLDLAMFSFEVKRCERVETKKWWKQTVDQASHRIPALFYRGSRQPWSVMVPVMFFYQMNHPGGIDPLAPVTMDIDLFCGIVLASYPLAIGESEAASVTAQGF